MTTDMSSTERAGGLPQTASNLASEVTQSAERQAETLMGRAGTTVHEVAQAVRSASGELGEQQPQVARWGEMAASRMDEAASYLEGHDPREILDEAQQVARRQPALVIGGGLVIGLALGRLLRTASEPTHTSGDDWYRRGFQDRARSGSASGGQTNGAGTFSPEAGATAGLEP
jgi:hypothetical protein